MKEPYHFEGGLHVIVILTSAFQFAFTQGCRTLEFRGADIHTDRAFTTNIISTLDVPDEGHCRVACYGEDSCKSFNLGPPQGGGDGKRVCELISCRHTSNPSQLVERPGFIYRPSVSPCSPPCPVNQTCELDTGGFSCFCLHPGFTGDACAEDIDECAANTHDCPVNATCVNNNGSFVCVCPDGYERNGTTCQDIDECTQGSHNCPVNMSCINTVGNYTCRACPLVDQVYIGGQCVAGYHWIRDEVDSRFNLRGAAVFVQHNGRTVLYLDGSSGTFAEAPAVPIRQTDMTIAVWVKLITPSIHHAVFADCAMRYFKKWTHLAVTWSRADLTVKLYVNGVMKKQLVAPSNSVIDFKHTGHSVYDIGYKRDSSQRSDGYFSDLMVFNHVLPQSEITNDLFLNHPFYDLAWKG